MNAHKNSRLYTNDAAERVPRRPALYIGLGGTEMVYFATSFLNASGGIMVTASHNPADYNGLKFVREEARPISADSGLIDIRRLAEGDERRLSETKGEHHHSSIFDLLHITHTLHILSRNLKSENHAA